MKTATTRYALKCLSAQGIAPTLADQVQDLYERNMAIAKQATIQQSRQLITDAIETLPPPFTQNLDDDDLTQLISQLIY